jgi:hypothetical protein
MAAAGNGVGHVVVRAAAMVDRVLTAARGAALKAHE